MLALSPSPALDIIESSAWHTLCSCLLCAAALSVPHGNFSRFSGSCRTLLPKNTGLAVLVWSATRLQIEDARRVVHMVVFKRSESYRAFFLVLHRFEHEIW